ncbi:PfkB family carbohydrate kinase [Acidithiobacillus sp. AMEEHan]|uniref:PfkB family carbohydrate kinase n=1 Tax=Acidithiobacillus sp. AMEEHan TaxID=2994951 RepID=UPI0027E42397|nr:PfkB family carbohydrate kinase [Acidithiobacillus sp. AMEEHan]
MDGWIFGECLLDDFGDTQRVGGAPFNVACHLWSLGSNVRFISRLGKDPSGARIRNHLQLWPDARAILQEDATLPTGRVLVHDLGHGEHRFEILPHQAYDAIQYDKPLVDATRNQSFWLYHGTLALRENGPSRNTWRQLASRANWRFVDINLRAGNWEKNTLEEFLTGASILKCNHEELALLGKEFCLQGADLADTMAALGQRFAVAEILVTAGAQGAAYWDGRSLHQHPAVPVQIRDTVGAGDAFSAGWIYARLQGRAFTESLRLASQLAAQVCALSGALPSNPKEFYCKLD